MANSEFYIIPGKRTIRYIFLFLICTIFANAQESESSSVTCLSTPFSIYKEREQMNLQKGYEQTVYWKRHKRLKKYAFSTLGLGICGTIVGWIGEVGNNAYTNSNWKNDGKAWDVVLGIGMGLTVSSIPLFVLSHKNKKRAKEVVEFSLKSSNIQMALPNGMRQTQHAVGVCMNF